MARDQHRDSRKLIHLSDHTRRRLRRPESGGSNPGELAAEAHWLGRTLLAIGTAAALYWSAFLFGIVPAGGEEAWRWSASISVGHFFFAATAAAGGLALLRSPRDGFLWIAFAGGAAAVLALTGLFRGSIVGEFAALSPLEVLAHSVFAGLAVWIASFLVRSEQSDGR
jgi:hypothetical protein